MVLYDRGWYERPRTALGSSRAMCTHLYRRFELVPRNGVFVVPGCGPGSMGPGPPLRRSGAFVCARRVWPGQASRVHISGAVATVAPPCRVAPGGGRQTVRSGPAHAEKGPGLRSGGPSGGEPSPESTVGGHATAYAVDPYPGVAPVGAWRAVSAAPGTSDGRTRLRRLEARPLLCKGPPCLGAPLTFRLMISLGPRRAAVENPVEK